MKTEASIVSLSFLVNLPGVLVVAGILALSVGSAACGGTPEGANIDDPTLSEAPVVAPVAPVAVIAPAAADGGIDGAPEPEPDPTPVQRFGGGGSAGTGQEPVGQAPDNTGSGTRAY